MYLFIYLFILGIYNDPVNRYNYTKLKDGMITEYYLRRDVYRGLSVCTAPAFVWRNWGINQKFSWKKRFPRQRNPSGIYTMRRKRAILLLAKLNFAHPVNKLPEFLWTSFWAGWFVPYLMNNNSAYEVAFIGSHKSEAPVTCSFIFCYFLLLFAT
jgi:hypothetical protein